MLDDVIPAAEGKDFTEESMLLLEFLAFRRPRTGVIYCLL